MKLIINKLFLYKNKIMVQYVIGDKMKKYLLICFVFLVSYCIIQKAEAEDVQIPSSAIRIRVIPNSNSIYDQEIKMKVKQTLENNTYSLLEGVKNIEEARNVIEENLANIELAIQATLLTENYQEGYKINFGQNYFPEKTYKEIVYEEGEYESIVVTLGKGEGDNWWCVLFPPLCLLEAEESEIEDTEYTFFVKELLDKYF